MADPTKPAGKIVKKDKGAAETKAEKPKVKKPYIPNDVKDFDFAALDPQERRIAIGAVMENRARVARNKKAVEGGDLYKQHIIDLVLDLKDLVKDLDASKYGNVIGFIDKVSSGEWPNWYLALADIVFFQGDDFSMMDNYPFQASHFRFRAFANDLYENRKFVALVESIFAAGIILEEPEDQEEDE